MWRKENGFRVEPERRGEVMYALYRLYTIYSEVRENYTDDRRTVGGGY